MKEITEYLINEEGMRKVYSSEKDDPDYNKFSCVLRIADIHYLFWSEHFKAFTIGVMHDRPKGKAGGGFEPWTYVIIPKVIRTIDEAAALINAVVDKAYMKCICQ